MWNYIWLKLHCITYIMAVHAYSILCLEVGFRNRQSHDSGIQNYEC